MALYKVTSFESFDGNIAQTGNHLNAHRQRMQDDIIVVNSQPNPNSNGRWFLAKCNSVSAKDPDSAEGGYYYIYAIANENNIPLINYIDNGIQKYYRVAAPCPPFCNDQSAI